MVKGLEYAELWVKKYEEQIQQQQIKTVKRLAIKPNLQLYKYQSITNIIINTVGEMT